MAKHHDVNFYIILAILFFQISIFSTFRQTALLAATASNLNTTLGIDPLILDFINQTNLDTLVHFVTILSGEDSVVIGDSTYRILCRNTLHPHGDIAADFIF